MEPMLNSKAGMAGLDKAHIEAVIREASKGSAFDANRLEKQARLQQRVQAKSQEVSLVTSSALASSEAEVAVLVAEALAGREATSAVVHVDMDAFYAAVESRDDPSLRSIPMAVGGWSMLSTSNYAARRFGVRAAMPGFIARKLCPQLRIVPCRFERYRRESAAVRQVLQDYDADLAMASLDEAYMNLAKALDQRAQSPGPRSWPRLRYSGPCLCRLPRLPEDEAEDFQGQVREEACAKCGQTRRVHEDYVSFGGGVEELVAEMRFRVCQATGLSCSAGIAPNGLLAKVASDRNKPNGQFFLPADGAAVEAFLEGLPTRKVSGIGGVSEAVLRGAYGVETVGELRRQLPLLRLTSTQTHFQHLLHVALGLGSTHFRAERERKSISVERTFGSASSLEEQLDILRSLADSLAEDLASEGLRGRTLTLKWKTTGFKVRSRAQSVPSALGGDAEKLFGHGERLLRAAREEAGGRLDVRLMGLRLSAFVHGASAAGPGLHRFLQTPGPSRSDEPVAAAASEEVREASSAAALAPCLSGEWEEAEPEDFGAWAEEGEGSGGLVCPVCRCEVAEAATEAALEAHVDVCLQRNARPNRKRPAEPSSDCFRNDVVKEAKIS